MNLISTINELQHIEECNISEEERKTVRWAVRHLRDYEKTQEILRTFKEVLENL